MMAVSCRSPQGTFSGFSLLLSASLLLCGFLVVCQAQISTDDSFGPRTTLNGPNYAIGHELGRIQGGNLLHSFHEFNVWTGENATFTGPATLSNIISRVTGGTPSFIDGTLQSDITGANVFLLNSNGLLFGANARLKITGSFHVSTADVLRFADGKTLLTGTPTDSGLSVANPVAFGFLRANPAGIAIQGSQLHVPQGERLSVVGGDLIMTGGDLKAPRGHIQLTSVASAGDVRLISTAASARRDVNFFKRLGEILLSDGAKIDTSGDGGGTVRIRGGRLMIDHALVSAETRGAAPGGTVDVAVTDRLTIVGPESGLSTTTREGGGNAGNIRVTAATVEIRDNGVIQARNRGGAGNAGTIVMDVRELTLINRGQISASARRGDGNAGTVTITATDRVTIVGNNTGVSVDTSGSGDAGRITLTAPMIEMRDEGRLRARTDRRGGNAGTIEVRAQRVELTGGAHIDTSARHRRSTGQAGEIMITANTLIIAGADSGVASATQGAGDAGTIRIAVGTLELMQGAQISTAALNGSTGSGGTVQITATDRVLITGDGVASTLPENNVADVTQDEGVSSTSWGAGNAGRVMIEAPTLTMRGRSLIHARSRGPRSGNAGTVDIQVARLILTDRAQISASSQGQGRAGTLTITATESVSITGTGRFDNVDFTGLSVSNRNCGNEPGGHMTVTTPILILDQAGRLRGQARRDGPGSQIQVHVQRLLLQGGPDRD